MKLFLSIAALSGALSVALGAFGAHGLKQILAADKLAVFQTGVQYQFYHTFAILAVGILSLHFPSVLLTISGCLFIAGIILFSGSLYTLPFYSSTFIAILTPVGGTLFITGWICLLFAVMIPGK